MKFKNSKLNLKCNFAITLLNSFVILKYFQINQSVYYYNSFIPVEKD